MAAKTASAEQMRFYHELGKQIRKVRELRGLSQKDMAVYLGITNQQYQKYEAGNNRMGVWFLYKISQFLDVSFAKIVFPENPNNIIRMVSHIEIKEHIDFLSKYIRNMAHELLD